VIPKRGNIAKERIIPTTMAVIVLDAFLGSIKLLFPYLMATPSGVLLED
jgi:hypothetical protein